MALYQGNDSGVVRSWSSGYRSSSLAIARYFRHAGGMPTKRTPQEAGAIIQDRRIRLKLTQDEIGGVSPSTVRKLETGATDSFAKATMLAIAEALAWPDDFYTRLRSGVDPADLEGEPPVRRPELGDDAVAMLMTAITSSTEAATDLMERIDKKLESIDRRLATIETARRAARSRPSAGQ